MANNVRQIREGKGMQQNHLAKILGISDCALSNKEAGRRPFTVEEVLKLEEILSVTVRDMFKIDK